jgi:glycosyltransferase involved in cell wall biosynthesis
MRTCCLINHFNYGRYVGEALDSALAQTVAFDEIVVVDDGSTDGSRDTLAKLCSSRERVRFLPKGNGGQLSCFNAGFGASGADLFFFLDADDVYENNWLEEALKVYRREPSVDYVFCNHRRFGEDDPGEAVTEPDRDLGYSLVLTWFRRKWIGGPTSCISAHRRILEKILPLPCEEDWRTRADDCLVFGSSLAGARKYRLGAPLVRYRMHEANLLARRDYDKYADYRRRVALNRFFEHMFRRMGYGGRLAEMTHREFRTIQSPDRETYKLYRRIALRSGASLYRICAMVLSMMAYYYFRSEKG